MRPWIRAHPRLTAGLLAGGVAVGAFGVVWFEPHKLFVDDRVAEAEPSVAAPATPGRTASPDEGATPSGPRELSRAPFRPLEHGVKGEALVLETPDGARHVRFEDLDVSNGPDLVVYLSVLGEDQGWYDADDADFHDLGPLKGNIGDQNYAVPADLDLSRFNSVVIWCRRFSVGFAVAPIRVGR